MRELLSGPWRWVVRLVLFTLITIAYQRTGAAWVPFTGDEPHNLMAAISLIRDGDFDLANNFREKQYRELGFAELEPQNYLGPEGRTFNGPTHGIGFPILLALPYRLLGPARISWFLLAVAILAGIVLAGYADRQFSPAVGTLAGLMLVTLPVWQIYGGHVYGETTAGTMALLCLTIVSRPRPSPFALVLCAVCLAWLPFLYLRYLPLAVASGLLVLSNRDLRRSPWLIAPLALCLAGEAMLTWEVYGGRLAAVSPGGYLITYHGFWERFWRLFFDRGHGIALEQPVLLLAFWAAPFLLRRAWRDARVRVPAAAVVTAALYSVAFAMFNGNAGECAPGRYLCAAAPLMLLAILHWALRGDQFDRARLKLVVALWGISLAVIAEGIVARTPPWQALLSYQRWFPFGWGPASFVVSDPFVPGESATFGVLLLLLVWLTKSLASDLAELRAPVAAATKARPARVAKPR